MTGTLNLDKNFVFILGKGLILVKQILFSMPGALNLQKFEIVKFSD